MHIPTVWAVYLYMLMNTVWRAEVAPSVSEVPVGRRGGTCFLEEVAEDEKEEEEGDTAELEEYME